MGMTTELRSAIRTDFAPGMTRQGFDVISSDLPQFLHFRKITPERILVCDIQWEKSGLPRFVVNFGSCGPHGVICRQQFIPPSKISTAFVPQAGRLSPGPDGRLSSWFRQDLPWHRRLWSGMRMKSPSELVAELNRLFIEVEHYWQDGAVGPHLRLMPPRPWSFDASSTEI